MKALVACPHCDLLQYEVLLAPRATAHCARCGTPLYRRAPCGPERTLAYTLAAAVCFVLANAFPLVALEVSGQRNSTTLLGAIVDLAGQGMELVAALVFATIWLAPLLQLAGLAYLLRARLRVRHARAEIQVLRLLAAIRPWSMVEVFVLGVLVALAKLMHMAQVLPGVALWSLAALMVLLAAALNAFDEHDFWELAAGDEVPQVAGDQAVVQ
ncbi:MAG: paraquat-inducible protein A [Rhodocyclaceae bacterium]|nr:paraquat-inducible protein A [Rhodocyclaceae bacterium]MBX3670515.1 paraquat-inducible protein A [Rhodocyclaceae bacterium]